MIEQAREHRRHPASLADSAFLQSRGDGFDFRDEFRVGQGPVRQIVDHGQLIGTAFRRHPDELKAGQHRGLNTVGKADLHFVRAAVLRQKRFEGVQKIRVVDGAHDVLNLEFGRFLE